MKNLNLFRKSARGSEGSTLASAVVRPSFDRRLTVVKHLAFMLLFLLGSVNVWGTTATITFANQTSGTSDGSAAYTTSNFVSTGIASSDDAFGTITCSATDKCYSGKVNMGLKSGAKSSAGSFTISFSTPITNVSQITLNRAAYNTSKSATITVKNGSTTLADAVSTGTNASLNNMDITGLNIASLSGLTVETSKYCYIKSITITYTPSGSPDPTVKNVQFTPDGGEFVGSQSVTLSQDDNKDIYYTTDATAGEGDPSTESPWIAYSDAINLNATTTIYAAAKDGDDWSSVTSKTFTKIEPLATMDAIFAAATKNGSTAKAEHITFNNWVVSGAKGQTAYVTDGTKGFIIYYSGHGFTEGDILSGTGSFDLKLYNGAAEITKKNSGTITITKGGTAPLNVLDADDISALSGINTGSLIKINGTCSVSSGKYYINNSTNTVQVYTTLYSFTSNPPEATKEYNCTGVYVQYNATKEIMPRKAADIAEVVPAGAPEFNPASKKFVGSISVELSQENSLPIYYTDDASKKDAPSITTWTEYTSAIPVTATKTIYAAALDGSDWSEVVEATYTLANPLATMEDVQGAATQSYDQLIDVTITNWVVTAVDNIGSADNKRVWIADADNTKGILLYDNTANHGFVVGKKLNGTVLDTKIKLYQGYAELTSLKAADVTVTDAEAITPRVTTIAALGTGRPAEQGTIVTLVNVTYNGTAFSDGTNTISIDTRLYEPTLTNGKKYNLTGVVFYSSATAIKLMPRAEGDVEELASHDLISISLGGTYPTAFETGDAFSHEGMVVTAHYDGADDATVTTSAEFSGYDMSVADTYEVTVSYTEGEITKTAKYNITVSDPAPTGDFEELDGELVAGDYLIYDGGSLMIAQIESSRFYYEGATPDANGIISNPSQYAVWTLAKSGDYWTIYNAKTGKYAAGTEAANKAQLLDDGTDDKSLWSISEELVVTNKANAAKNVNATLRHNFSGNSNYGFACYSATTGSKPVFYKQATPSYYISETLTGCTADANNPTKVPQALTEDVVLKYNLTTGFVWPNEITVTVGGVALDANELDYSWDTDKAPAELTIDYTKITGNIAITITATEKSLDNITIAQAPTKVAYETGEFFNPAGLQIQLNYTAGAASDVVVYSNETKDAFTFSPNLETALAPANTEVTITYGGKSVNQAITVTDPVETISVVAIIAKMGDNYYAMSTTYNNNAFTAIPVIKDGDDYTVPTDEAKADILWTKTTLSTKAKFQGTDDDYLAKGNGNTDLVYSESPVEWTWNSDGYYYYSSGRTFFTNGTAFKNYATSNISATGYSDVPEFIAEANIKVVPVEVHEFVVDPDEDVAFGTVEQNETVSPKSFDVTLTNITSATVTLSDDAAFSIDVTALTADGTITVTPNTANAGNFSATITLSDDAGVAADKVINVTMKVVEPRDCDRTDDFSTVGAHSSYTDRTSTEGWTAVNTAVAVKDEVTYWIMQGNTNSVGVITSPEFNYGIQELSLSYYYPFGESNGISFKVEIMQGGIAVKTETITKADAVQNTVYDATIENINVEGKYQIVFTNLSPTGSTSSKDRFAVGNLCWKKYGDPVYEDVRTGLSAGHYYTICYNKKMTAVRGASLWQFIGKDASFAYLEKATAPYPAGKPYVLYAESNKLEAVLEGDETNAPGANGAIHGTFSSLTQDQLNNYATVAGSDLYLVIGDELRRATGASTSGNTLPANRAFVVVGEIPNETPAQMPGRQVRSMGLPKDTPTGIDNAEASETPVKKLVNGQLFILRGEKMYNANGQLVK